VSEQVSQANAAEAERTDPKEFTARKAVAQPLLFLSPDREHDQDSRAGGRQPPAVAVAAEAPDAGSNARLFVIILERPSSGDQQCLFASGASGTVFLVA
jgi:hypothetical protein